MNRRYSIGGGGKPFSGKAFERLKEIFNFKNLFKTHNSQLTKLAFTLAETLIVMGIIGVVAALTLPNLNSSTGDKEKVAKLQKIYSNLQDAFGRMEAVYGHYGDWCNYYSHEGMSSECEKRFFDRMTEFMKYSKTCTVSDCMRFDAGGDSDGNSANYGVILADGSTIGFHGDGGKIMIDIDGLNKGPNKQCIDYFLVFVSKDKGVHFSSDYQNSQYSAQCTAWVLLNGNMDYLKTSTKEVGGACSNGKILDWTTNVTCK